MLPGPADQKLWGGDVILEVDGKSLVSFTSGSCWRAQYAMLENDGMAARLQEGFSVGHAVLKVVLSRANAFAM